MADRRKTVLIVDDDEGMRDTLTAVLRRDFRVLKTATGESALQIMEKEDVDLMMLDVRFERAGDCGRGDAARRLSLHL
jgi:DNA-binding NtrC family response regulator